MKKYLAFLLCFIVLFSMSSCNLYEKIFPTHPSTEPTVPDVTTPEGTTAEPESITTEPDSTTLEPEETAPDPEDKNDAPTSEIEVDPFEYYYGIVEAYTVAAQRFDLLIASDGTLLQELMLENQKQAQAFRKILSTVYSFYPYDDKGKSVTPERLTYYRYDDRTDINGDGSPELVFLGENYEILAIYSYSRHIINTAGDRVWYYHRDPVLLATFSPKNGVWIDEAGRIHVCYLPQNSNYKSHKVYEIAQGGARLNLIVEYGQNAAGYFQAFGEKEKPISIYEFIELKDQYGDYHNPQEAAEINREKSGLNNYRLHSIYSREFFDAMYRSVLNGEDMVLVEKTGGYVFLKDYLLSDGISLAKCETLRYISYDIDDNDIEDVVIDCGSDKLCLTYTSGKVVLKTLSNEEWETIPDYYSDEFCTLGAPWRERVMSPQEIEAIASSIWGVYDGVGDGACGTFYVYYIVVSDEPDEDGYYLVTWLAEVYGTCGYDGCTETDPNHKHLQRVEDNRYMLIHERTGQYFDDARVSLEGAKRYASAYWGIADGAVIHGVGRTFVVHIDTVEKVGFASNCYYAYLWVECYSTIDYEHGGEPLEIQNIDFVYIGKNDGTPYLWPGYVEGK